MANETVEKTPELAQVRLSQKDRAALREAMDILHLESISEALRKGIHLLYREAREVFAAAEIREYYKGQPAPVPDGVLPVTQADLEAADQAEW